LCPLSHNVPFMSRVRPDVKNPFMLAKGAALLKLPPAVMSITLPPRSNTKICV